MTTDPPPPQKNGTLLEFENTPDDEDPKNANNVLPCRFLAFQEIVRRIRVAGFEFEKLPAKDFATVKKLEIKKTKVTKEKPATSKEIEESTNETRETLNRNDQATFALQISPSGTEQASLTESDNSLVLRSPEDMIFYLGQIIRTRTGFSNFFSPKVAFGPTREEEDIFAVTPRANDDAPVEVTFLDKTYHIQDGSRRSMHTLSLVNQMILLQQSEKAPPGPQDVRVINP